MPRPNAIETELLKATNVKKRSKENPQDFFKRLIEAVSEVDEEVWDALSSEAQEWCNTGVEAANDNSTIPNFDGTIDADDAEEEEEEAEDEPTPKPRRTARKTVKAKPAAKPKAAVKAKPASKPKAAAKTKVPRTTRKANGAEAEDERVDRRSHRLPTQGGMKWAIKELLLDNPTMSSADILDAVSQEVPDTERPSQLTINGLRSEFRHTLYFLKAHGKLRGVPLP